MKHAPDIGHDHTTASVTLELALHSVVTYGSVHRSGQRTKSLPLPIATAPPPPQRDTCNTTKLALELPFAHRMRREYEPASFLFYMAPIQERNLT